MNGLLSTTGWIALAILVVLLARALYVVWSEKRTPTNRGQEPGQGYTVIDTSYHSGGPGGGHSSEIKIPRDPQEYARSFVPAAKQGQDDD